MDYLLRMLFPETLILRKLTSLFRKVLFGISATILAKAPYFAELAEQININADSWAVDAAGIVIGYLSILWGNEDKKRTS